jgi:hypothetical protein
MEGGEMKNRKRITMAIVLGLALLVQLMSPSRAYADGGIGTPHVEPPPAESPTPEPTALATDKPAVDLTPTELPEDPVVPVETATPTPPTELPRSPDKPARLVVSTPVPADPTSSEVILSPRVPTLRDVLRGLPQTTGVIVLDEIGKPLPLASQEAAQAIAQSDPVWCPDGQPPTPGMNGCTAAFATMNDLLANAGTYINSQTVSGTIWITAGFAADTTPVYIDGLFYTNWANYGLTLQGGWTGIDGDTTLVGSSFFSAPVTITDWNNTLSVNNIGTDTLNIRNTEGPVNLRTVQTLYTNIDNPTGQISISNSSGSVHISNAAISDPALFLAGAVNINFLDGDVTIWNSTFQGNGSDGVWLYYVDNVAISNSTFSGNRGAGVTIFEASHVEIRDSLFTGNAGGGIHINSSIISGVLLEDVTVDRSSGFGVAVVTNGGSVTINNSRITNTFAGDTNAGYVWGDGADLFTNRGTIRVSGSQFTGNAFAGLYSVGAGNITVDQSRFSENIFNGLEVNNAGNITINDSVFSDNSNMGVYAGNAGNITISGGEFSNNGVALSVFCVESVIFQRPLTVFSGNTIPILVDPTCPIDVVPPEPLTFLQTQGELFTLDCATKLNRYVVRLANGDRGEIFCPVSGEASIDRVDNTTLPDSLPVGYTYASAFEVKILQNDQPISVITEGGYITASFLTQNSQAGITYSILYWDEQNDTWIQLKDFLLDENGQPASFSLDPGDPEDERTVLSGVQLVTKNGETRMEVSTNFPGIFLLAQQ